MTLLSAFKMPSDPILRFGTYSLILLIAVVCAFTFIQWRTERNAKSFCSSVQIGSSINGLLKVAADMGAGVPMQGWSTGSNSTKTLMAKFTGIDPMYGYFCTIKAGNGVVVSKDLSVIDL